MKKLLVILVAIAASAFVMSQYSGQAAAKGGDGIPLEKLAGNYSVTAQGSLSVCLDKTKLFATPPVFAVIDCGNAKEIAIPQNYLQAGEVTRDEAGNSCATYTVVQASLPVDDTPPFVFVARHNVGTVISYDAATGTGDSSQTAYVGGTCDGSTFDP
jgi:hypothetical protein